MFSHRSLKRMPLARRGTRFPAFVTISVSNSWKLAAFQRPFARREYHLTMIGMDEVKAVLPKSLFRGITRNGFGVSAQP
jgi:hypothetical protein